MHRLYLAPLAAALCPLALGHLIPILRADDIAAAATCTETSTQDFEWTIEGFDFHASYVFSTPAHQNSWGYASFNLSNPAAPASPVSCSAASSQLEDFFYGNVNYDCTFNGTSSSGPAPATFAFSRASGELDVNQTWVCRDDPKYPARFTAYGKANLTLDCTETTWQNSNWTLGQIYSDREVVCDPVTLDLKPYRKTAVA